jgi:hypothetical protein
VKAFIFSLLIFVSAPAFAEGSFVDSIRPMVEKFFGEDVANSLFGEVIREIELPAIPKVTADATNMDVYTKKKKETVTFPEKKMNEYNVAYVHEVVEATRGVKANMNDVAIWMRALSQGGTREGVYRAMVLDTYYAGMENYDQQLSTPASDFAIYYMGKYVGKKITKEKIAGFNVYSIKRILTEKSLDILDVYVDQNLENFYDWYAHLSAELATSHPIWTNKLRSNQDPFVHKAWAKKVPRQFVKSEVIIKLHKLLNNLQQRN